MMHPMIPPSAPEGAPAITAARTLMSATATKPTIAGSVIKIASVLVIFIVFTGSSFRFHVGL
jgi:hypothetical protein